MVQSTEPSNFYLTELYYVVLKKSTWRVPISLCNGSIIYNSCSCFHSVRNFLISDHCLQPRKALSKKTDKQPNRQNREREYIETGWHNTGVKILHFFPRFKAILTNKDKMKNRMASAKKRKSLAARNLHMRIWFCAGDREPHSGSFEVLLLEASCHSILSFCPGARTSKLHSTRSSLEADWVLHRWQQTAALISPPPN